MLKIAYVGATVLILAAMNGLIVQKEALKSSGQIMFLQLAPRDPRSLMMGDYMALNYDISNQASSSARGNGTLVIRVDDKKVGTFVGVYNGTPLKPDERLLRFRERSGVIQVGPPAYYFQEGRGAAYSGAKYGELHVASDGDCLLVGLCDAELKPLGPRK